MGLFSKSKPVLTDEEFSKATDDQIEDLLIQERQVGVKLLSPAQRKALAEGTRQKIVEVAQAASDSIAKMTGEVSGFSSVSEDRIEESVESEVDLKVAVATDPYEGGAEKSQEQRDPDELLSDSQKLLKIKGLQRELAEITKLDTVRMMTFWAVLAFSSVNTGFALSNYFGKTKQEEAVAKDDPNVKVMADLRSNYSGSEFYRKQEEAVSAWNTWAYKVLLLQKDHIELQPKTPKVCMVLADLGKEAIKAIIQGKEVLDFPTAEMNATQAEIVVKRKAEMKKHLDEAEDEYKGFLKYAGYGKCPVPIELKKK